MLKYISIISFLLLGATGWTQKKALYSGLTVFREQDIFSPNSPFGISGNAQLGRLFVQADVRRSFSKTKEFQIIGPTESFGGKIGLGGYSLDNGLTTYTLAAGVQRQEFYKKIVLDEGEFPVDVNNQQVEADKVNLLVKGMQFSLGLNVIFITVNETGSLESWADDFDMKMNKRKKRYSTALLAFELLYTPKLNYSRSFEYSPYGFYVPREMTVNANLKERHMGVHVRLEYAPYTRIGMLFDFGLQPGIQHKADNYNDFGFAFRVGVLANVSAFNKD